jgi:hypothetical protein
MVRRGTEHKEEKRVFVSSLMSRWLQIRLNFQLHPTEPASISVLFVDSFKKIGDIERIGYNGMCGT